MSKKKTCRIWASSGSIPSERTAERWLDSGTVSLSSTLSAPPMSPRSSWRRSSRIGRTGAGRAMVGSPGPGTADLPTPARGRQPREPRSGILGRHGRSPPRAPLGRRRPARAGGGRPAGGRPARGGGGRGARGARGRRARGDGADGLADEVAAALRPSLRRALNATGVILHTNLGRAPLAPEAVEAAVAAARYATLEWDPASGGRGSRQDHLVRHLRALTGAESACVTTSNAAAVLLALVALGGGGEVLVSRGQLVEIGGGFRVPEVLAASGCRLVEVGTTNRTRLADYERAIGAEARAILRVHPSNFRVVGFAEEALDRGARGPRARPRPGARRRPRKRRAAPRAPARRRAGRRGQRGGRLRPRGVQRRQAGRRAPGGDPGGLGRGRGARAAPPAHAGAPPGQADPGGARGDAGAAPRPPSRRRADPRAPGARPAGRRAPGPRRVAGGGHRRRGGGDGRPDGGRGAAARRAAELRRRARRPRPGRARAGPARGRPRGGAAGCARGACCSTCSRSTTTSWASCRRWSPAPAGDRAARPGDRRARRPRQDRAGAGAHGARHRPPGGREVPRHLDRARLRAARACRRAAR